MSRTDGTQRQQGVKVDKYIFNEMQRSSNSDRRVVDQVQVVFQMAVRNDDETERREHGRGPVVNGHVTTGAEHASRVHI